MSQPSTIAARATGQGGIAGLVMVLGYLSIHHYGAAPDLVVLCAPVVQGVLTTAVKVARNVGKEKGWERYFA